MILFSCICGKDLRASDDLAGRKARCSQCATVLIIPPARRDDAAAEDLEDSSPYGLTDPEPRPAPSRPPAAAATVARPSSEPAAPSIYHPTPRAERPTRFKPLAAGSSPPQPTKASRSAAQQSRPGEPSLLEYTYLLLVFALIPLAVSLLGGADDLDMQERFAETIRHAAPEDQARINAAMSGESMSMDDAINVMPGGKLHGAHLARTTSLHWVYAAVAAVAYLSLLALCFSVERAHFGYLLGIGAFTATVGVALLLFVQFCAMFRVGGLRAMKGGGVGLVIVLVLFLIGWSYASAHDPGSNFLVSALGFTFGVGFCEEFTKAIPILIAFHRHCDLGWRTACLWGLASGIGFGVAEGVMYSAQHYNGISGMEIYLVRFISCVALHAMWSASVGIAVARNVDHYEGVEGAAGFGLFALRVMAVPMLLHGFYDTLLKQELNAYALLVALLSFAWLAWHIELARGASPGAGRLKFAKKWAY